MKFRVDEITSVIEEEIRKYRTEVDLSEVGKVLEVGDGIARIYGLTGAMAGELVQFNLDPEGRVEAMTFQGIKFRRNRRPVQ